MALAKKIAGISDQGILLSKDLRDRTRSDVKVASAEKESKENELQLFTVKKVVDSERNQEFIRNFLNKINKN